jgi:hypothetical protein
MDRKNRHLMRFPNDFENLGVEEQKVRNLDIPLSYAVLWIWNDLFRIWIRVLPCTAFPGSPDSDLASQNRIWLRIRPLNLATDKITNYKYKIAARPFLTLSYLFF